MKQMTIDYVPVGWNTSMFIGPTNMNKMDEGIKAACDGVDAANEKIEVLEKSAEEFSLHASSQDNPHSVTKKQVGLGNVNNTSDANKPISKAQQAAFDAINKSIDISDLSFPIYKYNEETGYFNSGTVSMFGKVVEVLEHLGDSISQLVTAHSAVNKKINNFSTDGTAAKAIKDQNGKVINDTYAALKGTPYFEGVHLGDSTDATQYIYCTDDGDIWIRYLNSAGETSYTSIRTLVNEIAGLKES